MRHTPWLQIAGTKQSELEAHALRQKVPPHWYGAQDLAGGVTQFAAPSQVDAGMKRSLPVGQLWLEQTVPAGYLSQAPFPSHRPSAPHVDTP